ncbi:hypothetical protein E3N88_23391 [Mikania micrantha]|uniref:Pentatricopeptide repeat-containing protein n=1 Tax=Mikania micrantha TaxID=192012 RepID=A0A5N6NEV0_9ASTR|nr:hypothetical protein E3N88_23391 [Mikania micrantha]
MKLLQCSTPNSSTSVAHSPSPPLLTPTFMKLEILPSDGLPQINRHEEGFAMFSQMLAYCRPNEFAYASVLSCCNHKFGRQVHSHTMKTCFVECTYVANALITMYSKNDDGKSICNNYPHEAWMIFKFLMSRNLVTYNCMIAAFQIRGKGKKLMVHCLALKTWFTSEIGVITALAKAYADLGAQISDLYDLFLETQGRRDIVSWTAFITIFAEQILSQVDRIKAHKLINEMPIEPDSVIWSAMLGACRKHGETKLAKLASKKLQELDPNNSLGYVQMSNIMCSNGTFNKAVDLRTQMNWLGVKKDLV